MHVLLLANYLPDEQESMLRYAVMLEKQLTLRGCQVEILRPVPFFGRLKKSGQGLGKWLGYLDKFLLFPFLLRRRIRLLKGQPDFLVHVCDHSNSMYTRWLGDVPHVVTCHDVLAILSAHGLVPENPTGWSGRILQAWILSGLRRARRITCDSEPTRRDLLSLAPELASRTTTVEMPLAYPFTPMPTKDAWQVLDQMDHEGVFTLKRRPFLFHIGGNQWYKNREGVLRILGLLCSKHPDLVRNLDLHLVLAGRPLTEGLHKIIQEEKIAHRVIFLGQVGDEQLRALYSVAEGLLFPSLREGFGWPLVEAQACRCPVITSHLSPMREVAGPAALLADPSDLSEFVSRTVELLSEGPMAMERRKKAAQVHAAEYQPEVFTEKIILVYNLLRHAS